MKIVKCPNHKCNSPIRLSEGRFVGGVNDVGGIIIQCNSCKTIFPCKLKNPEDASEILKNGKVLDSWIDEMPSYFEKKYNIKSSDIDRIKASVVLGYEQPPKPQWTPASEAPFKINDDNLEVLAKRELDKYTKKIQNNYSAYFNYYIKGRHTADKSFVIINYNHKGEAYKAVFAKQIETENDLNTKNLYLISNSKVNLEYQVDGIYTRDQSLIFLERFLNRWRYLANEVLLVVPFIGFNYKNSEEELAQLWNWLEINIDISKTNLITRKGTFNLFKQAQDNSGIPFEALVELGLLEPLIEKMNQNDTAFFQKSHAKYYVGVYDNYVEVLSGSFNIHQGAYFENITFKKYEKDFFKQRYLHMFKDFEYSDKDNDEYVHWMTLGSDQELPPLIALKELMNDFE